TGGAFAGGTVDLAADSSTRPVGGSGAGASRPCREGTRSVSLTNHTGGALTVMLQVCLEPADMIEDVRLDGENFRYQSQVVSAYDSAAVRGTTVVPDGETRTLTVAVSGSQSAKP